GLMWPQNRWSVLIEAKSKMLAVLSPPSERERALSYRSIGVAGSTQSQKAGKVRPAYRGSHPQGTWYRWQRSQHGLTKGPCCLARHATSLSQTGGRATLEIHPAPPCYKSAIPESVTTYNGLSERSLNVKS